MCYSRNLLLVALSLVVVSSMSVANASAMEYRQYGPHVHGVAQLNIAEDGNKIGLEFHCPAINITGFEHFPATSKQRQRVVQAIMTLQAAQQLFAMTTSAHCQLHRADVDTPLIGKARAIVHADFTADYQYECQNAAAVSSINVNLFSKFPSIKTMNVQLLTSNGQSATRITAQHTRIDF